MQIFVIDQSCFVWNRLNQTTRFLPQCTCFTNSTSQQLLNTVKKTALLVLWGIPYSLIMISSATQFLLYFLLPFFIVLIIILVIFAFVPISITIIFISKWEQLLLTPHPLRAAICLRLKATAPWHHFPIHSVSASSSLGGGRLCIFVLEVFGSEQFWIFTDDRQEISQGLRGESWLFIPAS